MSTAAVTLDASSFDYVRKLVLDASAIALESTKGYLVESRLLPLARKQGLINVCDLVAKLRSMPHGELHERVVDAMTTNETSFFRDIYPFEVLRTTVLPEIVAQRATRRVLNIWSAACSSGQEPFTIAMVLREHFPQIAQWQVKIHATDLSQEMLDRAASGVYSQAEVNRGLPAALLVKYFDRQGLSWVVKPEIRRTIAFSKLNLMSAWGNLPTMDVVFMRNVLIYFTPETKQRILGRVRRQLAGDGCLFLGGAESTLGLSDEFERINLGKTMLYRPSQGNSPALVAK